MYQDGYDANVAQAARDAHLKLVQHKRAQDNGEPAALIAAHYRAVLSHIFGEYPHCPFVVILEEDLVVAPDLLNFFAHLAPALDADPTLLAVSAYNDNGGARLAGNACAVYRTRWFPGLGWLASPLKISR